MPLVLLLTASMGAGHTGVATELASRFRRRGFRVEVVDLLQLLPKPLGQALRGFYAALLRRAPWLYEGIYRVWFQPKRDQAATVSPVTWFGEQAVKRLIFDRQPVAVVSTFHLCSRIIGNLRRRGTVATPSSTMIVDFAVHDLWIDPAVDLHVCLHPNMAHEAERRGAKRTTAPGPVVGRRFVTSRWARSSARASMGLSDEDRVVLVVGGSWGAGDLDKAVDAIVSSRRLTVLVVCGSDERLRRRLASRHSDTSRTRIMGWVGDMDRLMLAADVVVENAGGLTCMEALAVGRPVVSFKPIPGHGRANVEAMARCGIVDQVLKAGDLVDAVESVAGATSQRARRMEAAGAMFRDDAADEILTTLGIRPPSVARSR